jgi:diadenylate cyclase
MIQAFITFRILDLIDILFTAFLLYQVYRLIKGTVALNIFIGIFSFYLVWLLVKALNMHLLGSILGQFIGVGVIALIIVFQQEIRRFLLLIGTRYLSNRALSFDKIFSFDFRPTPKVRVNSIVKACKSLSDKKIGALIVIARQSELLPYTQTGDILNADTSSRLIESIFSKGSPLHDGAIIIIDEKINAARCVLPISENTNLPPDYGMRHRAALGMSELTDAVIIAVSEESGEISLAESGRIQKDISMKDLMQSLEDEFILKLKSDIV